MFAKLFWSRYFGPLRALLTWRPKNLFSYFGHLVIFQPVGTNLIHASRRCTIQPKLSLMLFGNTVKASCAALTGFITIMFAGYSDVKTSLLHRFGIGLTDSVLEKDRSHDTFRGVQ